MKRHENLKSAIIAFCAALLFLAAGLVVNFVLIKPLISEDNSALELLIYRFTPLLLFIAAAMFAIAGGYALANEIMIEKGDEIVADVTGIKEYFFGKDSNSVHYNLFAEWKCPANGKVYKYQLKNLPSNPQQKVPDNKVTVKISKSDPRQYSIML